MSDKNKVKYLIMDATDPENLIWLCTLKYGEWRSEEALDTPFSKWGMCLFNDETVCDLTTQFDSEGETLSLNTFIVLRNGTVTPISDGYVFTLKILNVFVVIFVGSEDKRLYLIKRMRNLDANSIINGGIFLDTDEMMTMSRLGLEVKNEQ